MNTKQRFNKWENDERKKLGDITFLDKYIVMFQQRDKLAKVVFVLTSIVMFAQFIYRTIILIKTPIFNNLLFDVVCFILFGTWVMFTSIYYLYLSDCIFLDHVKRWTEERQNISKNSTK